MDLNISQKQFQAVSTVVLIMQVLVLTGCNNIAKTLQDSTVGHKDFSGIYQNQGYSIDRDGNRAKKSYYSIFNFIERPKDFPRKYSFYENKSDRTGTFLVDILPNLEITVHRDQKQIGNKTYIQGEDFQFSDGALNFNTGLMVRAFESLNLYLVKRQWLLDKNSDLMIVESRCGIGVWAVIPFIFGEDEVYVFKRIKSGPGLDSEEYGKGK